MKIMITNCFFVLDSSPNEDIRKTDIKSIKVLVNNKKELVTIPYQSNCNIKELVKNHFNEILKNEIINIEQVYTLVEEKYSFDDEVNMIYIVITNRENLKEDLKGYQLLDFNVLNNDTIIFDKEIIKYATSQTIQYGSIQYNHIIDTEDIKLEKKLLQLVISYKYLISRIDNTDIIFKFMPSAFTLEDLRIVYEQIVDKVVDKSNFRKKIIKYCEPLNEVITTKGFRPSKIYRYKSNFDDIWI